jgi:hypothetical protein
LEETTVDYISSVKDCTDKFEERCAEISTSSKSPLAARLEAAAEDFREAIRLVSTPFFEGVSFLISVGTACTAETMTCIHRVPISRNH